MYTKLLLSCLLAFSFGACCTKEDCLIEYYAPSFEGFSAAETDTVRIVSVDMEGNYPPDTFYTRAVFYSGGGTRASMENILPFNRRNAYSYYLPALGRTYRIDGYEFSYESCNSCFPAAAESKDHAVLRAYRLDGVRFDGHEIVIRK